METGTIQFLRNSPAGRAVLFVLFLAAWSAAAASFRAELDRSTIGVGETATLSLVFEDVQPQSPPQPPRVEGLNIRYIGPSTSISIVNGRQSATYTFNYQVAASREGEFLIPPVPASVNGQGISSRPVRLKVTKAEHAETAGGPFMRIAVSKTEMFVGETVPVEIRVYAQSGRLLDQLPAVQADGFILGKFGQPNQVQTRINNQPCVVVVFKTVITAVKTGKLPLGPANMQFGVAVQNRRRDPFDDPFGFFGGPQYQPVNLVSDIPEVAVLPLPKDNVPPSFNGAIGQFEWEAEAGPAEVAVGDPITVRIRIQGRGTIDSVTFPEQPSWREFKTYSGSSKVENQDAFGLEGMKVFEQVVSPLNAGVRELPPFSFSFFDPEQKAYRTLTHPGIPLKVRAAAAVPQPVMAAASAGAAESAAERKDIVHIKPQIGALHQAGPPSAAAPRFWAFQALAPVLWFVSLLVRRHRDNVAGNPRLRRRRRVEQLVREGLGQLKQQADANQGEAFFATVFRLLQEQIGERLDMPAPAITEAVLESRIKTAGMPPDSLARLQELFQACNQARYAPVRDGRELASFIPKTEAALEDLRRLP